MHAVWTMENSICYGGHFYAVPNLLDTVVGLIHAFIGDDVLTNTQHVASRFLLCKMVHYFHHAFVVQNVALGLAGESKILSLHADHNDMLQQMNGIKTTQTRNTFPIL
jgi:hypothetical protein